MRVLFVRHGESEANQSNVIVSRRGDPQLTARGRAEALRAAASWKGESVAAVYTSPLARTYETAVAFLRPGLVVQIDERLHEIALGRWDGMTIPDIEAADGERYQAWKADPELGAPDGGEPLSAVGARIQSFLDDVRDAHQTDDLVVAATHSDCLKALVLSVLEAPWRSAQWLHLSNTAGLVVEWRGSHWNFIAQPAFPPE